MMFFSFAQAESQCERNFKDLVQNFNNHDFSNCDFDNFDFGKAACEAYNELGYDDPCTNGMRWTNEIDVLNFSGASLRGANFNFQGSSSDASELNPYNFTGADLSGVDFSGFNCDFVTFQGANLSGAIMGAGNYGSTTNFSGANFSGANLLEFRVEKANFTGAIMNGIVVPYNQDYPGSDFTGVISNNIRYEDGEIVHQPDFCLDSGDCEWVISEGKIINVNWGGSMPPSVSRGGDGESDSSDPNERINELNQNREYLSSRENFIQNERRIFVSNQVEGDSTLPMFYDLDANGDGSIEFYEYQDFFIFEGAPRDSLE